MRPFHIPGAYWPDCFYDQEEISPARMKTLEIIRAVNAMLDGAEMRDTSAVAAEIGVTRQAISKVGVKVAKLRGYAAFIRPQTACDNSALAAYRSHIAGKRRKKAASGEAPAANQNQSIVA